MKILILASMLFVSGFFDNPRSAKIEMSKDEQAVVTDMFSMCKTTTDRRQMAFIIDTLMDRLEKGDIDPATYIQVLTKINLNLKDGLERLSDFDKEKVSNYISYVKKQK